MLAALYKNPNLCTLLLLASAISAGMLSFALISEYGFGLHPCELCMAQRYPYAVIAAAGLASALFLKDERLLRYAMLLCGLLFWLDAVIAWYHAGVELGVFPGPSACTSSDSPGESLEDMRKAIMNAALVACDQPMAKFLGLSMAAWNGLAATLMAVFTFIMLRKTRKN